MNLHSIFDTPMCARLRIKYPIFQAGRIFVAHAELAAAVSNAGGLGFIGSGSMGARELKEQIRRCRAMTERPFGVDILFADSEICAHPRRLVGWNARRVEKKIRALGPIRWFGKEQ